MTTVSVSISINIKHQASSTEEPVMDSFKNDYFYLLVSRWLFTLWCREAPRLKKCNSFIKFLIKYFFGIFPQRQHCINIIYRCQHSAVFKWTYELGEAVLSRTNIYVHENSNIWEKLRFKFVPHFLDIFTKGIQLLKCWNADDWRRRRDGRDLCETNYKTDELRGWNICILGYYDFSALFLFVH